MALGAVHKDESTLAREAVLRRAGREGAFVPSLFRLEVGNTLLRNVRRGRYDQKRCDEYFANLAMLPITADGQTDEFAWTKSRELAERHKLSLYDASYLELALRLGVPLATLDGDLQKAALAEDVELIVA